MSAEETATQDALAGVVDGSPTPPETTGARPLPYLLLAGVVAFLVPIRAALGPVRDIDAYWHLIVGQEILAGAPVTEAGRGWSFAPVPDTWVSTQWLSEVVFARLEQWGGLDSLIYFRVVTTAVALVVLAAVTLGNRPARAGVWAFAFAGLALSMSVQDRSQQITFVLAPLVGWWVERLWREGRLPRWWVVLPVVIVWANMHGGWLLLPLGLGLAALARLLDRGWRDPVLGRAILLAAVCVAAACVSPAGLSNGFAALRFSGSTSMILEWLPARLWDWETAPFLALLGIALVSWARGRARPSRGEVALVLLLALFAFNAWRNLTPAALILAPLVTGILARALGEPDPRPSGEPVPLARFAVALGIAGTVVALVLAGRQDPLVDPSLPVRLIAVVAQTPAPQRVLNTYNVSGALLWFGGGPGHVQVGADGRADRYGDEYLTAYQIDMIGGRPGWETLFDQLAPTSALLRTDEPLVTLLQSQRHWVVVATDHDYVLLRPPGATGWPASP